MHYFPMRENWLNSCYTLVAIGLVVLGHLIRALAVGKRAAHTSGRNRDEQVAEALNSTGIYSMVRHPLYLGNITTYIGWAVFTGIDWLVPVFLVLFVAYYRLIIFAEEQFLTRKFGQDYLDWRKQTPLLLPAFWKYKANNQPFSIKVVLENEYSGWAASMTTAFVLVLFQNYVMGTLQTNQNNLMAMALFIVVFGFGMRYLKKKTRVFKVD
jgi:protein-S-isoprenylcysteine O-methyltransferase Ste14